MLLWYKTKTRLIRKHGSCVLKAWAVECQSISSIGTRLILYRHSIDTSVYTRLTLHQHFGWQSINFLFIYTQVSRHLADYQLPVDQVLFELTKRQSGSHSRTDRDVDQWYQLKVCWYQLWNSEGMGGYTFWNFRRQGRGEVKTWKPSVVG